MLSPSRFLSRREVDDMTARWEHDDNSAGLETVQKTDEPAANGTSTEVQGAAGKIKTTEPVPEQWDKQDDHLVRHPKSSSSSSSSSSQEDDSNIARKNMTNDEKHVTNLLNRETSNPPERPEDQSSDRISPVEDESSSVDTWDEKHTPEVPARKPDPEPIVLRFKKGRWGRYRPLPEQKLRNNLSAAVGFLEFANALDFAANVWNTIPVPLFAAALMGLGGGFAIILSFFACRDGVKAWRNIKLLRGERAHLKSVVRDEEKTAEVIDGQDLDVKIEVNRRELGQEIVDRFAMDIFMGFSSLIVGIGTLLAIGGANPRVYHASNLLSGYIGNSPSAFWGLGNTLWSAYLFRRAGRHHRVGTRDLENMAIKERLGRRTSSVRTHSFVMGLATLVSAPCGIITATKWQGYPPLIPCILLSIWGNFIWRRRLGYTRFPVSEISPTVEPESLIGELTWTIAVQDTLWKEKQDKTIVDVDNHRGNDSITMFMRSCGLLEDLCLELLRGGHIKGNSVKLVEIDGTVVQGYEKTVPVFAQIASKLLQKHGLRVLRYRERYLLELLGASVYDAAVRKEQAISRREATRG